LRSSPPPPSWTAPLTARAAGAGDGSYPPRKDLAERARADHRLAADVPGSHRALLAPTPGRVPLGSDGRREKLPVDDTSKCVPAHQNTDRGPARYGRGSGGRRAPMLVAKHLRRVAPRSPLLFVKLFKRGRPLWAPATFRLGNNGRPLVALGGALGGLLSSGACPPACACRPTPACRPTSASAFPLTTSQPASPPFLQEYPRLEVTTGHSPRRKFMHVTA
jgi:hypothetical protein